MKISTSITEGSGRKLTHPRFATVGDGDVKALALQAHLDGDAHHRIIIDYEYTRHSFLHEPGFGESRIAFATSTFVNQFCFSMEKS